MAPRKRKLINHRLELGRFLGECRTDRIGLLDDRRILVRDLIHLIDRLIDVSELKRLFFGKRGDSFHVLHHL